MYTHLLKFPEYAGSRVVCFEIMARLLNYDFTAALSDSQNLHAASWTLKFG